MNNRSQIRRRNYFIKKRFQTDFSIRFFALIVIEAALAIALFTYLSKGTLTAGYQGSALTVASTFHFFLPSLLFSNLVIVAVTGLVGLGVLIYLSHRIAGPLYRFEKVLSDIGGGDLTQRFRLREKDQLTELANGINALTSILDKNVGEIKSRVGEISRLVSGAQTAAAQNLSSKTALEHLFQEISKNLLVLTEAAAHFKTSHNPSVRNPQDKNNV